MKLKRQGFYKEMPHGKSDDPSIFDFIQKEENADEEQMINYLKQGIIFVACGGVTNDIINPANGIVGIPDMLTDGIWLWPGDLSYYLKRYHVVLGTEFIKHMQENKWTISDSSKIDLDDIEI